jgi:hypothetical protein
MKCKKCGQSLPKNCLFCTSCGAEVVDRDTDTQSEEVAPEIAETNQNDEQEMNKRADEPIVLPVSRKLSAGRIIGAGAVSVFAVIFLIVFNCFLSVRLGFDENMVSSSAESLSAERILDSDLYDDRTVTEYMYDTLSVSYKEKSSAEPKDVRSMLIKSGITDFIAEQLCDYSAYLVTGSTRTDPSVNGRTVVKFLKANKTISDEELGYPLDELDYNSIAAAIDEDNIFPDVSDFGSVHLLFSLITLGIIAAIVIVFYIWIAIILDRHFGHIWKYLGVVTTTGGVVTLIATAVCFVSSILGSLVSNILFCYMVMKCASAFMLMMFIAGIIELIIGVTLFRIGKICMKKKAEKEKITVG